MTPFSLVIVISILHTYIPAGAPVPDALDSSSFWHRRTKLKQTEVDCEYLKRCCETLAQENRRLQREVAELRGLRTSPYPFYGYLPAAGFISTARIATPLSPQQRQWQLCRRCLPYSPGLTSDPSPSTQCSAASRQLPRDVHEG